MKIVTPPVNGIPCHPFTSSPRADTFLAEKIAFLHGRLDRGYPIFRLHPIISTDGKPTCGCHGKGHCPGVGKHPADRWSKPLNPKDAQARVYVKNWVTFRPDDGWGIHIGHSGLAVLDVDARHGGIEALAELVKQLGITLPAPHVLTSKGGYHIYFLAPANVDPVKGWIGVNGQSSTKIQLADGVELFFGQRMTVLPFSFHWTGCLYAVGSQEPPVPLPIQFCDLVNGQKKFAPGAVVMPAIAAADRNALPAGFAAAPAGDLARVDRAQAWLDRADGAVDGQRGRDKTFSTIAAVVIDFGVNLPLAWQMIVEYNRRCQPPWEIEQLREMFDTVAARPGERGAKLRNTAYTGGRRSVDIPAWLDTIQLDLVGEKFVTHLGPTREKLAHIVGQFESYGEVELATFTAPPRPEPEKEEALPIPKYSLEGCTCFCYGGANHKRDPLSMIGRFPGRCWWCNVCREVRRQHYHETHEHHLRVHAEANGGMDAKSLYAAAVPTAIRELVTTSIRVPHGSFFHIDHRRLGEITGATRLIISKVPTSHCEWEHITPRQAIDRLRNVIEAMPINLKGHWWWSSNDWALLKDEVKKESNWEFTGKIKASVQAQDDVLEGWDKETKPIRGSRGRWPWTGRLFPLAVADRKEFWDDIDAQAPLSRMTIELPGDDWSPPIPPNWEKEFCGAG